MAVIVTMQDVRELGLCSRGSRELCARYGIDWMNFLQNGIPAEELSRIDDDRIRRLIAHATNKIES